MVLIPKGCRSFQNNHRKQSRDLRDLEGIKYEMPCRVTKMIPKICVSTHTTSTKLNQDLISENELD